MKTSSTITYFLLLFFVVSMQAQTGQKIYLNIESIPRIQHKVQESKGFSREDKSPTITYWGTNDPFPKTLEYDRVSKSVTKRFEQDYLYLKLRYNPGKYQYYVLRGGDSVFIEYSNGKPYLEVSNRSLKKHDAEIVNLLEDFDVPTFADLLFSDEGRLLSDEEKDKMELKLIDAYDSQMGFLDSLYNEQFLSYEEYAFNKSSIYYKKLQKTKEYPKEVLTLQDLHVESYKFMLSSYIRTKLKKPTISLGNGLAQNSLEAFDKAKINQEISIENRNYLLEYYLSQIKIDFPVAKYEERQKQFKELTSKNLESAEDKEFLAMVKTVHTLAGAVELVNAAGIPTSLQDLLDQHKGKAVYIDFWASWCAPCRAAFPSYPDLEKEYENKDIVFLFVSTDEDEDRWQKANMKEGLSNSYRATNYPNAEFYKELNLRRIPRYLIFGKDGTLGHHKAPGPSSDQIRSFLDDTLKE